MPSQTRPLLLQTVFMIFFFIGAYYFIAPGIHVFNIYNAIDILWSDGTNNYSEVDSLPLSGKTLVF